jgi:predicted TIM-barrel fold metal-dependent hydrolase
MRSIDCHAHIIDPHRFPIKGRHGYVPGPDEVGLPESYSEVLKEHDVQHAVLVQPSCYGTDNSAMLDVMASHPGRYKGIAVVDASLSEDGFDRLHAAGVVGMRFNLVSVPGLFEALFARETERLLAQIAALGWFVQVYADDSQWPDTATLLRQHGMTVIIDHFGVRELSAGIDQPGFESGLALGRDGLGVCKLSAAFRLLDGSNEVDALKPFVAELLAAFGPERCIWGSDWPFLGVETRPDYAATMTVLDHLLAPAERRQVMWDNPYELFGFAD